MKTNLEIVKVCNNFPSRDADPEAYDTYLATLWKFYLPDDNKAHGFIIPGMVAAIPWTSDFLLVPSRKEVHLLQGNTHSPDWEENCNLAISNLLKIIRSKSLIAGLGEEKKEKFAIVGAKFPIAVERGSFSLFGIIGLGVHMTVYSNTRQGMKIWVAQRNAKKGSFPGMLDNCVAGGMAQDEGAFECMAREADEEAGLDAEVMKAAKPSGTISWIYVSERRAGGPLGLVNPGVIFVYDLEVPEERKMEVVDADVHGFELMGIEAVLGSLRRGEWKPASANVMIDFLVRHGLISMEGEPQYVEIVEGLHQPMPFPMNGLRP